MTMNTETVNFSYKYQLELELSKLRQNLISIKRETDKLKIQQELQFFDKLIGSVVQKFETIVTCLENTVVKESTDIPRIEEMSANESNMLPLPWECYDHLLSIFSDLKKLKTILEDPDIYTQITDDELNHFVEKLQVAVHSLHNEITDCDEILEMSKKFADNMSNITTESKDGKEEDDSDLGCYPHEESDASEDNSYIFLFPNKSSMELSSDSNSECDNELGIESVSDINETVRMAQD